LVDDQPLLDELLFASYVQQADPKVLLACQGNRGIDDAELAAFQALQAGDWQAVLDRVQESRVATALLRQYSGDARWNRRELHSAELEYRAGLALQPTEQLQRVLEIRVQGAAEQLKPVREAEAAATRNGWLAGLMAAIGVALI